MSIYLSCYFFVFNLCSNKTLLPYVVDSLNCLRCHRNKLNVLYVYVRASFQPMEPSWEVQCVFLGPIPLEGGQSPHPETHQHLQ